MKIYLVVFCVLFFSCCKKENPPSDMQTIKISNKSAEGWNVIYVYSIVRNTLSDSLIIKNTSQSADTTLTWSNIKTADEDAHFEFKVCLNNNKSMKAFGGHRDDLPYSKITSNMSLAIYSDSVKISSY